MHWLAHIPEFIVNYLVEIILALVVTFIMPKVYDLLKIQADDHRRALIETAMRNGLIYAIAQARKYSIYQPDPDANLPKPSVSTLLQDENFKGEVLQTAAEYVKNGAPSTVRALGVTDDVLAQRLDQRLPEVTRSVASGSLL